MLALTLKQPWAWAICYLGKRIENRTWKNEAVIGKVIAIHAGVMPVRQRDKDAVDDQIAFMLKLFWNRIEPLPGPQSGVVAVARVTSFVSDGGGDPWFDGPIGWVLRDVIVLPKPVPCKGALGLWTLPPDVETSVRSQYAEVRTFWKAKF